MEPKTGKLDVPLLMGLFEDLVHLGFYLSMNSRSHSWYHEKNKTQQNYPRLCWEESVFLHLFI